MTGCFEKKRPLKSRTAGDNTGGKVGRYLQNLLRRLESLDPERIPCELTAIIDDIKQELYLLEERLLGTGSSLREGSTVSPGVDPSCLDSYHKSILDALTSLCANVIMNARDISSLKNDITAGSRMHTEEHRLKRLLADSGLAGDSMEALSKREIEILDQLLEGKSNREISEALAISQKTVKNHLWRIYRKLGVENRAQLLSRLITR